MVERSRSAQSIARAVAVDRRCQEKMWVFDCAGGGFGEKEVIGGAVARGVEIGALAASEFDGGILHCRWFIVEEALAQEFSVDQCAISGMRCGRGHIGCGDSRGHAAGQEYLCAEEYGGNGEKCCEDAEMEEVRAHVSFCWPRAG